MLSSESANPDGAERQGSRARPTCYDDIWPVPPQPTT